MATAWNDTKSFKRHLEDMKLFRLLHHSDLEVRLAPLEHIATLYSNCPPGTNVASHFKRLRGKSILIPVWEIVPPRNSQN